VFHADRISNIAIDCRIQRAKKLDCGLPVRRRSGRCDPVVEDWTTCRSGDIEVWLEVGGELWRIAERVGLGIVLDKEVERIDHPQVRHQADSDVELARFAREDRARQIVAEGILLPVDEVISGRNRERVRLNWRS
jgi:hypothetical protein